jgi:hypothetical protein
MRQYFIFIILILSACAGNVNDPQRIIDEAIDAHGAGKLANARLEFDFRDRHYVADRKKGRFSYERIFKDSTNTIHDILTNDGFRREINGGMAKVIDTMAVKYTSSVNSTVYFASLPYGLNDAAVRKRFVGENTIEGQPYFAVEITFEAEGGGEDHRDIYYYWIHQQKYTMDYFAYSYHNDDAGIRFRKASKQHEVNGVILQDYINYKPKDSSSATIENIVELYKKKELEELSRIEITNIKVMEK